MSVALPEFGDAVIRVDKGTNFASLKDLLMIFGYSEANVNKVINGLPDELREKCTLMQLNGVGNKMLCAPANILIEIVWALKSSKTHEFRSQCAKTICRVLGGDTTLADEIERRHSAISTAEEGLFMVPAQQEKQVISITLPEFGDAVIRVDKGTNYASLKDLLMIFGYSEANVSKVINGLPDELRKKCTLMQLNGAGNKMLCAPANILIEIVWALKSSKTNAFRSQCAKTICRVLGGDMSLAEEIEKRHMTVSRAEEEFFMAPVQQEQRVEIQKPVTKVRVQIQKHITKVRVLAIKDKTKPLRGVLTPYERSNLWNMYYGNVDSTCCILDGVRMVYKHHAGFEAAHVKSVFNSGDNEAWNMVPICAGCNADMGTMHLLEWVIKGKYLIIASHSGDKQGSIVSTEPRVLVKRVFDKMYEVFSNN